MAYYPFEAWYESGTVVSFEAPQTWRNVFSSFKRIARTEGHGELYCNGFLIRLTGRNDDVDYSIFTWCSPVPEPYYGLLDAYAMYERDELAVMEVESALVYLRRQMEVDCCMFDAEAFARELESSFYPWGDFDWKVDL